MSNRSDSRPDGEVRLAPPYSWKTTLWKAVKVGGVGSIAWLMADPTVLPAITEAIPAQYRVYAALLIPMAVTAVKNWVKQNTGAGSL